MRFRRLRLRIGGNELAPRWLLDGVSAVHPVEHVRAERLRQRSPTSPATATATASSGSACCCAFRAMEKDFSIGAQLVYGRVTGPTTTSRTGCSASSCRYCPVGTFELRGIRLLVAGGMSPDLPEPSGRPQEMRLLGWYQQYSASGAVEVRSDRSQQRGGWKVEQGADGGRRGRRPVPVGEQERCSCARSSSSTRSDSGSGLLVAAEVFALKAHASRSASGRSRSTSSGTSAAR